MHFTALIHDLMRRTGIYSNDDTTGKHHVVRITLSMKLPLGTPIIVTQPYRAYETCVDGGVIGVGPSVKCLMLVSKWLSPLSCFAGSTAHKRDYFADGPARSSGMLRRFKIKFVTT